jgi:hypothetical protein
MRYVADPTYGYTPPNPSGIQRHPYQLPGWSPDLLGPAQPYASMPGTPGAMGAVNEGDDTLKTILTLAAVGLLLYFIFGRAKSNPGVNKVAKVRKGSRGGWYWRLLRKGAKRHGPYGSRQSAIDDAEGEGYEVLS